MILAADDLAPSETLQLDKSKILGFITQGGSGNSHTAILARTMNIPALVGVDFQDDWDGKLAVLDPSLNVKFTMRRRACGATALFC